MGRRFTKFDWWVIGLLTLIAAVLRFAWLSHPGVIVFDETYFANFAHNYLTNTPFFDAEPPLAKFFIAGGEHLFGFNPFGWRFATALFGTAIIPLLYIFAKRLLGGRVAPVAAGLLGLFDGLLLVESRVAVIDGFVVFFNLLTYVLLLASLQARSKRRSYNLLWLAGISFGLGLSVKWITLAFAGTAAVVLFVLHQSKRPAVKKFFKWRSQAAAFESIGARAANLHSPWAYLAILGLVPMMIYTGLFSLHIPFDSTRGTMLEIHQQIYGYHHRLKETHPYGSVWWTWPLLIRPVAYYFQAGGGKWEGIVALGNPLVWWAGIGAMLFTAWQFVRTRSLALFIILFGFVAHFAPWGLIDRVLFIYHYLGGLPFVILALAYTLEQSWRSKPKDPANQLFAWILLVVAGAVLGGLLAMSLVSSLGIWSFILGAVAVAAGLSHFALNPVKSLSWGAKQMIAFLVLAGLGFLYFLPIWTGIGLDIHDYMRRMWLKSWI